MFRLSAVYMYFSSTIRIEKCTGFKKSSFFHRLDDLQICSSNVFFIDNPDPDEKLRLKLDPKNYFGSTTLHIRNKYADYNQRRGGGGGDSLKL
jgi:hypothetical protein